MAFRDPTFKRKFCLPLYKSLKLTLAEALFQKDALATPNGDPYPLLYKTEDCIEEMSGGRYTVRLGKAKRFFSQFFPYATYELSFSLMGGEAGLCISLPSAEAVFTVKESSLFYSLGDKQASFPLSLEEGKGTILVTCRPGAFDLYEKKNGAIFLLGTVKEEAFATSHRYFDFIEASVSLLLGGGASILSAASYIDSGIAIADIRPIRYENGEVMVSEGKIYLTATLRMEEEGFEGVLSWIPGTAEFALTGALFFDAGDGLWANDVASSLLFDRNEKKWLLWVASFSNGHILGHAAFSGDPRYGTGVIDISLMEKAKESDERSRFLGFEGDEDPDFIYDEKEGRWLFSVCRLDEEANQYRYFFFASQEPFSGYRFLGKGKAGAETGGSFLPLDGEMHFVCGNSYSAISEYRVYNKEGFTLASFDLPDGGFRGWGTVIPLEMGSRRRLFLLTFDRQNASSFRWSYGNLYCFEAP